MWPVKSLPFENIYNCRSLCNVNSIQSFIKSRFLSAIPMIAAQLPRQFCRLFLCFKSFGNKIVNNSPFNIHLFTRQDAMIIINSSRNAVMRCQPERCLPCSKWSSGILVHLRFALSLSKAWLVISVCRYKLNIWIFPQM